MSHFGFIQDKLEIKFLILYIMSRIIESIPFDAVQDMTMCDDGIDYFDFSECLADLVRTGHLTLQNDVYNITQKGIRNSEICESSLPYSVRIRADRNLAAYNQKLRRKSLVRANVTERENGTYTVSLSLSDDVDNLMNLSLMVTQKEMAKDLEKRFQKNAEHIYITLINTLLHSPTEEKFEDFDEDEDEM